ncbi:uncharacterized protein LOC102801567 [Saccoglossus kowalevskii]|uniref:Uncharacterized protein LOC102801567 n=1 Tax=Saccoglossus kowalevskii TaxID=10224 RepID=A0ABM0MI95_SACKO|nr:PREDICTED: uncharacterized protein LOC102801567 [Saccoglossus kowalevskii]
MMLPIPVFLFFVIVQGKPEKRAPEIDTSISDAQLIICIMNVNATASTISWSSPLTGDAICDISYCQVSYCKLEYVHTNRPTSGSNYIHPNVVPNVLYKVTGECKVDDEVVLKAQEMTLQLGTDINTKKCSNDEKYTASGNSQTQITATLDHTYKLNITDLVIGVIVGSVGIGIIVIIATIIHGRIRRWHRLRRFLRMRDDDGLTDFRDNNAARTVASISEL